ncbi:MAG: hypothetical protein COZ46_05490 [Verrucomicrobia bacterium CG_4_10_14_3_um_filter_43_23]|nr:MAG: hypothetical protein AUJ82_06850 [Verrucomicrobia bacterium CG1_02_43_26]PIX58117.1 MAG: hypothetical protein COZ46_05490 [Verrucomicrobia bacterium CG_4_10_14_3_um_filter_43_23]PIY61478.1 MAG: hypothetical protein COY94_05115 [Verrucomicrobia bacterium CG_4_10_14_0_8_um_filter_43_34]PJA43997.1 MAG: hypothetical protein CO175_05125 [Verrucomicrobia bacterium CG_4_9_14_3_um_filter_43_20]
MDNKTDNAFFIQFYEAILAKLPEDTTVIELLGHLYTRVGRIDDGLAMDKKLVHLDPKNAMAHYNLACSYALKSNKKLAVEYLYKAFSLGYDDLNWLLNDSDLANLHNYPQYIEFVKQISAQASTDGFQKKKN